MKTYTIYFELFGKKLKLNIEESSAVRAKASLIKRLNEVCIREIRENRSDVDNIMDILNGWK